MKKKIIATCACALFAISSTGLALSADQLANYKEVKVNQGFHGTVPGNKGNFFTSDYYRGGSGTSAWSVDFQDSSEGPGTLMAFWIEKPNMDNLVKGRNIKEGSGMHNYYDLNYVGDVHLAAENNNTVAGAYSISGIWDEE